MATFERYFLADKETHREKKNPYYSLLEEEDTARRILREFGLSEEEGHIINGHVPVKSKMGKIRSNAMAGSWSLTEDSQRHIKKKQGLQAIR